MTTFRSMLIHYRILEKLSEKEWTPIYISKENKEDDCIGVFVFIDLWQDQKNLGTYLHGDCDSSIDANLDISLKPMAATIKNQRNLKRKQTKESGIRSWFKQNMCQITWLRGPE